MVDFMALPSTDALINGLSATMIVVTGYIIGFRILSSTRHRQSKLMPWQAVLAIGAGSFYLGTVVSFWLLFFTEQNIQPREFAAILCYTSAPLAVVAAMVIGFSMIKPSWTKPIAIIYAISGIPFIANLWFDWLGPGKTVPDPGIGNLIDIKLESLSMIFTAIYILSLIVIVASGFVYLARHSTGEIRTRSIYYAAGFYVFAICGILDTEFQLGAWMIAVRLAMVVAYILLYKAMIPAKEIKPVKDVAAEKSGVKEKKASDYSVLDLVDDTQ